MKNITWQLLGLIMVVGCGVRQSAERTAGSPFSDVFLTSDSEFSSGTNLCVVIDHRPAGGADALDSLVVNHAQAAILEARKVTTSFLRVIFLIKDEPRSHHGVSAGFTVSQLEEIVKNTKNGKKFDSLQSWPNGRFPIKQ